MIIVYKLRIHIFNSVHFDTMFLLLPPTGLYISIEVLLEHAGCMLVEVSKS
jgi:hypothetical protein